MNGSWREAVKESLPVINPATSEVIGQVQLSSAAEVQAAVDAAAAAFVDWRRVPATERNTVSVETEIPAGGRAGGPGPHHHPGVRQNDRESRGELRRAIENVEAAAGIPILMQSEFSEDVAPESMSS